ncbi:hypothetical protein MY8738_008911 [Beauveria namnaoensis]
MVECTHDGMGIVAPVAIRRHMAEFFAVCLAYIYPECFITGQRRNTAGRIISGSSYQWNAAR